MRKTGVGKSLRLSHICGTCNALTHPRPAERLTEGPASTNHGGEYALISEPSAHTHKNSGLFSRPFKEGAQEFIETGVLVFVVLSTNKT